MCQAGGERRAESGATRAIFIVGTDDLVGGRAHVGERGQSSSIMPVVVPTS